MKRSIRAAAEADILRHFEWYAERTGPDMARRFRAAVAAAINELVPMIAESEEPPIDHHRLAGLPSWPVAGFEHLQVYYLPLSDQVAVIRILSDKRDVGGIVAEPTAADAGAH